MKEDLVEFVAIDFEHATNFKGSICSVGIATFRDGKIVDEYYSLVKPPNNEFSPYTIAKHKITPEETKNARTFGEIYNEIKSRIYGKTLVAHGAFNTDRHCLEQAMKYENIFEDLSISWKCTLTIVNVSLDLACKEIGVELEHHHALSDAKACGHLYCAIIRGDINVSGHASVFNL
jgi:DNA polymerase-3 subunit epsilon